jgi:hypothetical protein
MGTYKIWRLIIQKEWAWKSIFPLWKRGMKGDFLNNYFHKISPNPSFPKRGIIPPFGKGRAGGIFLIKTATHN